MTPRNVAYRAFQCPEQVQTGAGGARAKAVIAWNPATNEVRSGHVPASPGFGYWLIKFDGVSGNKDKELEDPTGYGALEYAYALMARDAGIEMSDCRLLIEGARRHFMTRRFDRTVVSVFARFADYAERASVMEVLRETVAANLRVDLPSG